MTMSPSGCGGGTTEWGGGVHVSLRTTRGGGSATKPDLVPNTFGFEEMLGAHVGMANTSVIPAVTYLWVESPLASWAGGGAV